MSRHKHKFEVMMDDDLNDILETGARLAKMSTEDFFAEAISCYAYIKEAERRNEVVIFRDQYGRIRQLPDCI